MNRVRVETTIADADKILADLSTRQFLRPHAELQDVLSASAEAVGYCPQAATHAREWLDIEPSRRIGRLRRTELTQLARSIHRFWRHTVALDSRASRAS